jgi:hypothetical protein
MKQLNKAKVERVRNPQLLKTLAHDKVRTTYLSFCLALKYARSFDRVDRLFAYRIQSVDGFPFPVRMETTSPFRSS